MPWHREHVDIVECVTYAQRSRRAINDLAERNADGADINDLAESLLLTEKKHIISILV
jgi:Zn ribbon nucleic-acid-binding protein